MILSNKKNFRLRNLKHALFKTDFTMTNNIIIQKNTIIYELHKYYNIQKKYIPLLLAVCFPL